MWTVVANTLIAGTKAAYSIGVVSKDRAQRTEDKLRARLDDAQAMRRKKLEERKQRERREANGEVEPKPGFFKSLFK